MIEAINDGLARPDEYMPSLADQVHTLAGLVDDLFELARIDAGDLTLELAETFVGFDDPVRQVLLPLGVNVSVGLGDTRERAEASHLAAARLFGSIAREGDSRAAR